MKYDHDFSYDDNAKTSDIYETTKQQEKLAETISSEEQISEERY